MTPLKPFAPPTSLPFDLPTGVTGADVLTWLFYAAVLYWLVYSIIAIYHWLVYSHSPTIAIPVIALHVFVSLVFIGYAVTGIL